MQVIPIQPVPSQLVLCVLGGQNCQISVYLKGCKIYVDLNSNGANMCLACLAHNGVPLDSCNSYDGFQGNLYFIDTQGLDDPKYTGFGTRWFLVYLTAAEVLDTAFVPEIPIESVAIMTLSAMLEVTSDAPGNFSVAHGLDVVPFLIEILPTSAGSIWGQSDFVDENNVNLVASDTGVTATILVFTAADSSLTFQTPAVTLLVDSPSYSFSVPHGLASTPSMIEILPTSGGLIWAQDPAFDGTNVYLAASSTGLTSTVSVYAAAESALNIKTPATTLDITSVDGEPFAIPHGLPVTPSRIEILMLSGGLIWAQTPAFDGTNVYLQASDADVVAKILVYA